jgi:chaperone modulatory protein CbpM
MKSLETVTLLFADLGSGELAGWIAQRWVQPEPDARGGWSFRDIDVARTRLIYDLRRDMDTPEATMPVVLSLLDQIYELRRVVDGLGQALAGLPADVRLSVEAELAAIAESRTPR